MQGIVSVLRRPLASPRLVVLIAFVLFAQLADTITTYNLFLFNTPKTLAIKEGNSNVAHLLHTPTPAFIKLIFIPLIVYGTLLIATRKWADRRYFTILPLTVAAILIGVGYTAFIAIGNSLLPH